MKSLIAPLENSPDSIVQIEHLWNYINVLSDSKKQVVRDVLNIFNEIRMRIPQYQGHTGTLGCPVCNERRDILDKINNLSKKLEKLK